MTTVCLTGEPRLVKQGVVTLRGVRLVTDPFHAPGDRNPHTDTAVPVFTLCELLAAERDRKGEIVHSRITLTDVRSRKTATRAMRQYMAGQYME